MRNDESTNLAAKAEAARKTESRYRRLAEVASSAGDRVCFEALADHWSKIAEGLEKPTKAP